MLVTELAYLGDIWQGLAIKKLDIKKNDFSIGETLHILQKQKGPQNFHN